MQKGSVQYIADPFMASIGNRTSRYYAVYIPPNYDPHRSEGYPVLYLLNGFGGNENYFITMFSATDACDQLQRQGEIDPMILILPSGYNNFGGSFYCNSLHPEVGESETHILDIIAEVEKHYNIDRSRRAIGGHSMGGYGAFSIAMNHPQMFLAVSAISAPLAFWGTMPDSPQTKGMEELLPQILEETGYDSALKRKPQGDLQAYRRMLFPSPQRRITTMLFAMAAAFSPTLSNTAEITNIGPLSTPNNNQLQPIRQPIDVDLPINIDGTQCTTVWKRWLEHDVNRRLKTEADNLRGVKLYLDAGREDDLGMNDAHRVFAAALARAGIPPDVHNLYDSAPDLCGEVNASVHTRHTEERLRELLKWHSRAFYL